MKAVNFPACCTATILKDFGQSVVAEGGADDYTEEEITKFITKTMQLHKQYGRAMVVVTTNSTNCS